MSSPACSSGPNHTVPAPAQIDNIPVEIFEKILLMTLASCRCKWPRRAIPGRTGRRSLHGIFLSARPSLPIQSSLGKSFRIPWGPMVSPLRHIDTLKLPMGRGTCSFLICQPGLDDTFVTILEEFVREHDGSAKDHDLESLEITALKNSVAVVERLRLPSLKRLVYADDFDLILRSDPPLTYLQLRSGSVDEVTLVNVLRLLPTLDDAS
ncbi:hypothetical protein ACEPAI_7221 [Sanghuangporus weigelae]